MAHPADPLPKTRAIIDQGMRDGLHLGTQLFVSLNNQPVVDFAAGESAAGVAMRPDTLLLWFSAVKPITAIAIASLWELGKLQLDDPVVRFIPEFANQGKEHITLRHLLTHTGGFRAADKIPEELGWDETITSICQTPLESGWVPGERAGYHLFSSWFLLGEIVRRIEGRPFSHYVRQEVFERLGMFDSWLGMPPDEFRRYGDRIGVMHLRQQGQLKPHPFWNTEQGCGLCRPGSNGRGPIRELARFYEALKVGWASRLPHAPETTHDEPTPDPSQEGNQATNTGPLLGGVRGGAMRDRNSGSALLSPSTIQTFTSRQRVGMFDHTFNHVMDWGLGFIIDSNCYGAETVPYGYGRHCSERTFGHSGSQSSCAFADPSHGLVVAWACNGLPGERLHQQRARELNSAIYEDLGLTSADARKPH